MIDPQDIYGIIPPLVTPFKADGSIDEPLLRADVRYLIDVARVHGLTIGGSTGEGHTLTAEETRHIVAIAVEEADGRVPVIAGIITDSTRAALERARLLADLKIAALQVTPVHYVFRPDDDAMCRYFGEIAEQSKLPIILYNVVPWSYLPPKLVLQMLRDIPGVIGVKQSANDLKSLADILLFAEEAGISNRVRILTAVDAMLYPSFQLGAHGAIAAILAAAPDWCVALWEAVAANDQIAAQNWHKKLLRLWNAIEAPNLPATVRTTMQICGRHGGYPRAPMAASSPEQQSLIKQALDYIEEPSSTQL